MNKKHNSYKKLKEIITDLAYTNALLSEKLSLLSEFINESLLQPRLPGEQGISLKFDRAQIENLNLSK